nr:PREDICTED: uncharacterized protein LOC109038257 [Bemisia tabaci]
MRVAKTPLIKGAHRIPGRQRPSAGEEPPKRPLTDPTTFVIFICDESRREVTSKNRYSKALRAVQVNTRGQNLVYCTRAKGVGPILRKLAELRNRAEKTSSAVWIGSKKENKRTEGPQLVQQVQNSSEGPSTRQSQPQQQQNQQQKQQHRQVSQQAVVTQPQQPQQQQRPEQPPVTWSTVVGRYASSRRREEFPELPSGATAPKKPNGIGKPRRPAVLVRGEGKKIGELNKMLRGALRELGKLVADVRMSAAGDLVVETETILSAQRIQAALARSGRSCAETKEPTLRLVVSRVDADMTEGDIREEMVGSELEVIAVKLISTSRSGGRMIWLDVKDTKAARAVMAKATIRIGFMLCPVRAFVGTNVCFKCRKEGHTQFN